MPGLRLNPPDDVPAIRRADAVNATWERSAAPSRRNGGDERERRSQRQRATESVGQLALRVEIDAAASLSWGSSRVVQERRSGEL